MGAGSIFLLIASVAMVLAIVCGVYAMATGTNDYDQGNSISVTGSGEVTAVPDIATISFTVHSKAADVAAAQKTATESSDAVIKALRDKGIAEKDIKTDSYTSNPEYQWEAQSACRAGYCPPGNQKLVGYEVSHSMTVKVRDLNMTGDILAVLGSQKVENMYGPNFTFDDDRDLANEAREKAIEDARGKAKELADQLNVRLGKLLAFYENGNGTPMPYMMKGGVAMDMAMSESAVANPAPTLPAGENTVSTQVTLTYRIR